MSKFVPPPDQINNINPKKSKKSFDENGQSIFSEVKKVIKDSFAADAFEQVGALNAVVLEIREPDVMAMFWRNPLMFYQFMTKGQIPDYIEVRYRIPEMHAHLPEPSGPDDWLAINLHPYAIMKKEKGMPQVGDIVVLDFQDKNNFRGAQVLETLNTNENPNSGGNCKATGTPGSAAPPLNMSSPSGDSQQSKPEEYSASNSPTTESSTQGINYPLNSISQTEQMQVTMETQASGGESLNPTSVYYTGGSAPVRASEDLDKYKKNLYFVTIEDLRTMSDFRNVENSAETLLGKKVGAVCFSVAEGKIKVRDISKIKQLIDTLKVANIDVGLSIEITSIDQFHDNFIFMAEIAKSKKVDFITYHLVENGNASAIQRHDIIFDNFSKNLGINYYAIITENTKDTSSGFVTSRQSKLFIHDNYYDFIRDNENTLFQDQFNSSGNPVGGLSAKHSSLGGNSLFFPSYYLGGINFLSTPNDPCVAGERSLAILEKNIRKQVDTQIPDYSASGKHVTLFMNYKLLQNDNAKQILSSTRGASTSTYDLDERQKQRFLSSDKNTQKTNISNVVDKISTAVEDAIQAPTFNSSSTNSATGGTPANGGASTGDSQTPAASSPSAFASKPGMQCSPIPAAAAGGAGGPGGAGGAGAAVDPPSFRFDSIENYQNLGWTANNSAAINNVILEFMEKFSAAVYRRLPANSPSFTGSDPKKIRLTSTARTFEKQASLMWDKIKNGGGDSAVYSLYGRKEWTEAVVNAYHAGNFEAAVAAVEKRVNAGGGSAHLKGKGVDVHTWSHLRAEGIPNPTGANISTMNSSKYVQAIVEAAKEVGARPVVEAYQQHVHITIS